MLGGEAGTPTIIDTYNLAQIGMRAHFTLVSYSYVFFLRQ